MTEFEDFEHTEDHRGILTDKNRKMVLKSPTEEEKETEKLDTVKFNRFSSGPRFKAGQVYDLLMEKSLFHSYDFS